MRAFSRTELANKGRKLWEVVGSWLQSKAFLRTADTRAVVWIVRLCCNRALPLGAREGTVEFLVSFPTLKKRKVELIRIVRSSPLVGVFDQNILWT